MKKNQIDTKPESTDSLLAIIGEAKMKVVERAIEKEDDEDAINLMRDNGLTLDEVLVVFDHFEAGTEREEIVALYESKS